LHLWERDDPRRTDLIAQRPETTEAVAAWVREVHAGNGRHGLHGQHGHPTYQEIAANATLSLLVVACSLLDRQINAQAHAFEKQGGFTERLYKIRKETRDNSRKSTIKNRNNI